MRPARGKEARAVLDGLIGKDQDLRDMVVEEHLNVRVARMIHDVRKEAGLTQKELAKLVGTTQSVISQLEDADYEGHSLSMLQRIATALHRRLKIAFGPAGKRGIGIGRTPRAAHRQ